jgi:hypothetical protein
MVSTPYSDRSQTWRLSGVIDAIAVERVQVELSTLAAVVINPAPKGLVSKTRVQAELPCFLYLIDLDDSSDGVAKI